MSDRKALLLVAAPGLLGVALLMNTEPHRELSVNTMSTPEFRSSDTSPESTMSTNASSVEEPSSTTSSTHATTTSQRAAVAARKAPPTTQSCYRCTIFTTTTRKPPAAPQGPSRAASSTAYCLTGRMSNGERVHKGAVANNWWPLGTKVWVSDSPWGPGEFTVKDRIGHGSELDFGIPGDCAAARRWGRRTITVRKIT